MAKDSFEFKLKVLNEYISSEGSYGYLAKKYNLSDSVILRRWVGAYKEFGDTGLMRSRQNKNYSFQFKLNAVKLYLSSEVSYQELALSQGLNNPFLVTKWGNDFRIAGPDALRPKKKGCKKALSIYLSINKITIGNTVY